MTETQAPHTPVAVLLNRLILASTAKGAQTQHDIPREDRITDADIERYEQMILARFDDLLAACRLALEPGAADFVEAERRRDIVRAAIAKADPPRE